MYDGHLAPADIVDVKITVCAECQAETGERYPYHMATCSKNIGNPDRLDEFLDGAPL
jgi:hypothetical protein